MISYLKFKIIKLLIYLKNIQAHGFFYLYCFALNTLHLVHCTRFNNIKQFIFMNCDVTLK